MKFIYLQDTHIKGVNPISRKGDYYSDIMTKIDEILSIANERNIETIIHGGDLFDTSLVSNNIVDEIIDKVERSKTVWYIVWGNHDLTGHNLNVTTSGTSSLAHILRRSTHFKHISALKLNTDTIIKGYDYYHNIESDLSANGLLTEGTDAYKIAVIHALITEKPFLPQVMHVVAKNIKTNYDLVLVAHYHQPYDITVKKTRFLNVGCLGRTSIDESSVIPTIVYVDTTNKIVETIELTNYKQANEAFDLDKIEEAKHFESNIENFIKSIDSAKFQGLNLRGTIENLGKENNIEKEVIDELITRIGDHENV